MIELCNVNYAYQEQPMSFNFMINKGELVTILGPSGAGKSTLLNLIAGFIMPDRGQIILNGIDNTNASPAKRPVSMLFQDNNLFTHLTVKQNLALGLTVKSKLTEAQHAKLIDIAKRIGLFDYLDKYPQHLSGGQRQRVAIGRCLLMQRPILLLDEPFSSLDPKLKKEILYLVNEIQREYQLTILMVTHQFDDIDPNNNRCLVVVAGQIIFDDNFNQLKQNSKIANYLGLVN